MLSTQADALTSFEQHGGRLCVARALYPQVDAPWIDLSTGINPTSYPAPVASRKLRARLPEPAALQELESTARAAFGISTEAAIAAVGGTEAAVRLLPQVLGMDNAFVAGPTYASHSSAWSNARVSSRNVAFDELPDSHAAPTAITIVNPNNPDGRIVARARLLELHECVARSGGVLIVDEAFADVDPAISVADIAGSDSAPRMVVLRSFGKFFGLAGLRLGFVIAAPAVIRRLRELLGDWPVSVDAIVAGRSAYANPSWSTRMRTQLQRQSRRMDSLLGESGFQIAGGTSLYRLASAPDARQRFSRLLAQGVLARPFGYDPTLLRFGLPARSDWGRLEEIMRRA